MPVIPGSLGFLGGPRRRQRMQPPASPMFAPPPPGTGFPGPMGGAGVPNLPYQGDPRPGQIPQDFPPYNPPQGGSWLGGPMPPGPMASSMGPMLPDLRAVFRRGRFGGGRY